MKTRGQGRERLRPIHRFLKIFTDLRPGEATTALLLTLNVFLLLLAYYLIKPVRETLILMGKDAQTKAYLGGAQAILLIFVIKGFSRLASKVPRHLLITWVTLFFISNLALFYVLHLLGMPKGTIGIIFFVWIGIFNIFTIAQFWGFANDIYSEEDGKRIFPMIAIGQTLGAVFGWRIADLVIGPFGRNFAYYMMLMSGGILVICIGLTFLIHKREIRRIEEKARSAPQKTAAQTSEIERPLKRGGGFSLIFQSRYLLFYALVILSLNFVNSTGEFIWSDVLKPTALKAVQTGSSGGLNADQLVAKISADYQGLASLIALIIQLFLVSRIIRWAGVGGALLFLPLIALGGYGFITFGASLVMVKWIKALENGTDYSLMNTTKGALFLITSREEKYKGKAAADTFFYRGGDALAAVMVFVGFNFLGFSAESFARLNVAVIVVWIFFCVLVIREYRRLRARAALSSPGPSA